jgi:hypothetical protein
MCGSFTFTTKASKKSEVLSVEEVGSYSLNAPKIESFVDVDHLESSSSSVVDIIESKDDFHTKSKTSSRQLSIVSVSEDEHKEDQEMNDLFDRIKKQRNALDDIMSHKDDSKSNTVQKVKKTEAETKEKSRQEVHVIEGTLSSQKSYTYNNFQRSIKRNF